MEKAKKLLYITRYYTDQEFHLKRKFDGQIAAFKKLGFDVYYLGLDKKHVYLIHDEDKTVYGKTHYKLPQYIHTMLYYDLHKAAVKAIREIGFDYVYWRSAPLWRSSCKVAEAVKKTDGKLLIEIPTFPTNKENNSTGIRKLVYLYSGRFTERFSQLVDAYAVIGEDASGVYNGKPAINIENGIDINSIPVRKPIVHNNEVHLLAVSAMRYWHGYDRLIHSVGNYRGKRKVFLHLVGGLDGECAEEWMCLAEELNISGQIIFHGNLYGNELDELADLCDLGCASLKRYHYVHISELKTREYVARGLPFILSLKDKVFDYATKQFYCQIPNDDSIPDMNEIVDFAIKMRNDKDVISYMRSFAADYLTWETEYNKLFHEFEKRNIV